MKDLLTKLMKSSKRNIEMKDLPSKLVNSNATVFYRQPSCMDCPPFLQENIDPPFYDLSKISTPNK